MRKEENEMLCCPFSKLAMHFTFIVTKQFKNNNRAYHLNTRKTTVAIQYKFPALPISRPSVNFLAVAFLCFRLGAEKGFMDWPLK